MQSGVFTISSVLRYPPVWSVYWALFAALAVSSLATLPQGVSDAVTAAGDIGRGSAWLLYRCDQDHALTALACITLAALMCDAVAALLGGMLSLRGMLSRVLVLYGGLALLSVFTMAFMKWPYTTGTLVSGIAALLTQVVVMEAPPWWPRFSVARWPRGTRSQST
ncbi:hypothetical protein [Mycobacteroides abscessus]|uniref:hypothetical protein n=1 Tax=Mycobacteroides abscessus TaxID=36809 RepID=UPI00189658FB